MWTACASSSAPSASPAASPAPGAAGTRWWGGACGWTADWCPRSSRLFSETPGTLSGYQSGRGSSPTQSGSIFSALSFCQYLSLNRVVWTPEKSMSWHFYAAATVGFNQQRTWDSRDWMMASSLLTGSPNKLYESGIGGGGLMGKIVWKWSATTLWLVFTWARSLSWQPRPCRAWRSASGVSASSSPGSPCLRRRRSFLYFVVYLF